MIAAAILNLAYLALVSSTLFRGVLWLRAMLMAGAAFFVVYGVVEGITSMVIWNLIIGVLHGRQIFLFVRARRAVKLTDEDERFRQNWFPDLDPFDFSSLWSMGDDNHYTDTKLTTEGAAPNAVYLILEGLVSVRSGETVTAELGSGALVGEISFLSGGLATADTFAVGDIRVREWEQSRLATLDQLNPASARALREFIGHDVAKKLN